MSANSAFSVGGTASGTGTVTSVGISSTDLTVTNSPVTISGTINLSLNTVSVAKGGTGLTTTVVNELFFAPSTSTIGQITTLNNGTLVTSGAGVPSISVTLPIAVQNNITNLGTIAAIGAPLGAAFGGSGVTSPSANGILSANGASAFTSNVLTDGELLIGSTGNAPVAANLIAGANIVITNTPGGIEITSTGGGSGGDYILLDTQTASSSSFIDFTGLSTTYAAYKLIISGLQPSVNGANLLMRCSMNNGASYDASNSYNYVGLGASTTFGTVGVFNAGSATGMTIINNLYNAFPANNAEVTLYNAAQPSLQLEISSAGSYVSSINDFGTFTSSGDYGVTGATNAIRLLMSTGNIVVGTFRLYGILASGSSGPSGAYQKISSQTASSSSTIEFTGLSNTYSAYKLIITGLEPQVNGADFLMRCSTNNGSSYDSGNNYNSSGDRPSSAGSNNTYAVVNQSAMVIIDNLYYAAPFTNCEVTLYNAGNSSANFMFAALGATVSSPAQFGGFTEFGQYYVTNNVNAIQLLMSTNLIAAGTFTLYGILA